MVDEVGKLPTSSTTAYQNSTRYSEVDGIVLLVMFLVSNKEEFVVISIGRVFIQYL